jgi:hypothetical protein
MKGNELARWRIHGDPAPLFIGLVLDKAPHFIGFGFQPGDHDDGKMDGELDMKVIGARRKAFNHKMQEPRQTHSHGPAEPPERDALAQQLLELPSLLRGNTALHRLGRELAVPGFTLMILLPVASMAIVLVPG